jgi:hypothetical protein
VVAVPVADQDLPDLLRPASDPADGPRQLARLPGRSGVDQGEDAAVLDEEGPTHPSRKPVDRERHVAL